MQRTAIHTCLSLILRNEIIQVLLKLTTTVIARVVHSNSCSSSSSCALMYASEIRSALKFGPLIGGTIYSTDTQKEDAPHPPTPKLAFEGTASGHPNDVCH